MARSERLALAAIGCLCIGACDAIAGLGDFQKVDCEPCAADSSSVFPGEAGEPGDVVASPWGDTGPEAQALPDAQSDATLDALPDTAVGAFPDVVDEAILDANEGGTLDLPEASTEGGVAVDREWARWVMPNSAASDAGAGDGGDAGPPLPNQAHYGADTEGNVTDLITTLVWTRQPRSASTPAAAATACMTPWRLATRIELVSILDTTRAPMVNPVFDVGAITVWSASPTPDGLSWWTVDFNAGLVNTTSTGSAVLCVQGGP